MWNTIYITDKNNVELFKEIATASSTNGIVKQLNERIKMIKELHPLYKNFSKRCDVETLEVKVVKNGSKSN